MSIHQSVKTSRHNSDAAYLSFDRYYTMCVCIIVMVGIIVIFGVRPLHQY